MSDDEFNPDITPYDLAERLVAGREITETGKREIAAELLELRSLIERCFPDSAARDDIARLRARVTR